MEGPAETHAAPPLPSTFAAAHPHLISQLAASADPQLGSAFFTELPLEIRKLIYIEFWRLSGLRQHITTYNNRMIHVPCITDPDSPDERYAKFKSNHSHAEVLTWQRRLNSGWTIHWACGEKARALEKVADGPWSPFLPVLLTCKRFYLESHDSILESLTFCLTDILLANRFLSRWPADKIRSLDISLQMTASLTDFYMAPDEDKAIIVGQAGHSTVTARHNFWETLCKTLASQTNLRDLHVWVDSMDLRPWHKSAVETRLFAGLFDVRAYRFVLSLPELPEDPAKRGLPGCYLEGSQEAGAPFMVRRGSRPDKWLVHLATRAANLRRHHEVPLIPSHNVWQSHNAWQI